MHSFLLKSLIALALVSLSSADLADNEIDDQQEERVITRARYTVRACKPCEHNQCQVMGMQRFSEPRCEAFGGHGAPCRPFQEPENKTLSFPNMLLYCNHVYMQFCPCARGLVCDPEEAECRYPAGRRSSGRPQHEQPQPRPQGRYPFAYAEPERYTSDEGLEDVEIEFEDESAPVGYAPLTHQRLQESLAIRARSQWLP